MCRRAGAPMAARYDTGLSGSLRWHDMLVSTDVASRSQGEPDSDALIFAVLRSSSGNWRCPRHRLGESWSAGQAHGLSRLQDAEQPCPVMYLCSHLDFD